MADRYRVILSPEALGDLERIFEYISRDSVENAARMVDVIFTECASLELFPHRYPVDRRGKAMPFDVRLMPVPPYRVLYRIMEEHLAVRILTIRHGRQTQWP